MAQHRWSIPFVGGYTYIQSDEEFKQTKENITMKLDKVSNFFSAVTNVAVGAVVVSGRKIKKTDMFNKVKAAVVDLKKEGDTFRTKKAEVSK